MKIGILSIGDELLSGSTLNTNAHFIAGSLSNEGYSVVEQLTVSDEASAVESGIKSLFEKADCIISTGGLGPTCDDITREIVEGFVEGAPEEFPNQTGSAPGLWYSQGERALVLLPGVPSEMRQILTDEIVPRVVKQFPLRERSWTETLHLFHKHEGEIDPFLRELKPKFSNVQFGIYPGYGTLSVKLVTHGASDKALREPLELIRARFKNNIFSKSSSNIERALQERMIAGEMRLGLAESCTGGAFAARLTAIPDASRYFEGSVTSYSNEVKESVLGVSKETLDREGAVSSQTVGEMTEGVHRLMDVDVAVSISGIAGPSGGTEQKPVGTIWAAIQFKGAPPETFLVPAKAKWGRDLIITYTVNHLIGEVLKRI